MKNKFIKLIWIINDEIEINNKASQNTKNITNLNNDNKIYIEILDNYTNLIYKFFDIPKDSNDIQWIDLIYNSPKVNKQIYIDIKTQTNIDNHLNIYLREFNKNKIDNRNYIIFNKKNNKLNWKIYFIDSKVIKELKENIIFKTFLEKTKNFWELNYNIIEQIPSKNKLFNEYKKEFNKKIINIDDIKIKIIFLEEIRKDKNLIKWNTNFKENIKIEFFL